MPERIEMFKAALWAILFTAIGLVAFALAAPLVFAGDPRQRGQAAFPIVVAVCAAAGFAFGLWRRRGRE